MPKVNKRTVRQHVESILRDYPDTRSNDKLLTITYWKLIDRIDLGINEEAFVAAFINSATMPESIRRARQLIQEEGLYLPDDATVANRRGRQAAMRSAVRDREVV
ncbi:hypothetical protein MKY96_32660 [Paenibacillus sp. FSL R7-0302]|uniref:hypothetical protein n=1 Tax=Paenibacillus sp. FSL R7-0302 TaxID=2921681 RepID=UPI0030F6AE15